MLGVVGPSKTAKVEERLGLDADALELASFEDTDQNLSSFSLAVTKPRVFASVEFHAMARRQCLTRTSAG